MSRENLSSKFELRIYSLSQLKQLVQAGRIVGCKKCNNIFDNSHKQQVQQTGYCPCCGKVFDVPLTI